MTEIILATHNKHKARELKALLSGFDVSVLTLDDISTEIELREDGDTFESNALQKARMV
ncbi:MAG: non-canonical purine NTP pyrophosphatase, partial [Ignavibacteriae bacterium]